MTSPLFLKLLPGSSPKWSEVFNFTTRFLPWHLHDCGSCSKDTRYPCPADVARNIMHLHCVKGFPKVNELNNHAVENERISNFECWGFHGWDMVDTR